MWRRAALHHVLGQNTDRRRTEECGTGGARTSIQSVSRTQWSSRYSSSLLVFATGQPPPGRELVPAGRPRDGRYTRGGGSAPALRTDQNGSCFRQAQV